MPTRGNLPRQLRVYATFVGVNAPPLKELIFQTPARTIAGTVSQLRLVAQMSWISSRRARGSPIYNEPVQYDRYARGLMAEPFYKFLVRLQVLGVFDAISLRKFVPCPENSSTCLPNNISPQLPITIDYRNSLPAGVPIANGCPLPYNGKDNGYRNKILWWFWGFAESERGSIVRIKQFEYDNDRSTRNF